MNAADVLAIARSSLSYDASNGSFAWLVTRSSAAPAGRFAGSRDGGGYVRIALAGRRYLAHRLAWLMHTGQWPKGQIDHINGDRADNRLVNLRDVDAATNQQNRHRAQGNNPFLWVTYKKLERRWRGAFRYRGRDVTVGHFDDAEAAHRAVLAARRSLGIGTEGAPAEPAPAEASQS